MPYVACCFWLVVLVYCRVPIFQSFCISRSVIGGLLFFDEYADMTSLQLGLFALGVVITIAGLVGQSQQMSHQPEDGDYDDNAEASNNNSTSGGGHTADLEH